VKSDEWRVKIWSKALPFECVAVAEQQLRRNATSLAVGKLNFFIYFFVKRTRGIAISPLSP